MPSDMKVAIYYGPLPWFRDELGQKKCEYLLDIVNERDAKKRHHTHSVEGQPKDEEPEPVKKRLARVVAESSDYASIHEHAIVNFVELVRATNPKTLVLHNPPSYIHDQLEREYNVEVNRYEYPTVNRDALRHFRDGFADHLVGQVAVREALLAAMYPLATGRRNTPVVLMFYGPSGVGKTETAQFVNDLLGGELMRKQFSMYHSDKFVSYLFGGSHLEGSFARDLLNRESGVILMDEFDKANPIFHSAFYQLFDSGTFVDKNYSVEVGASLIICTSNYSSEDEIRDKLGDALRSRFDALIRFDALSNDEIKQVIDRLFDGRFAKLDDEEKAQLDCEGLRTRLHEVANKFSNVRTLGKFVDTVISTHLVRAMLDGSDSLEPSLE